MPKKRRSWPDDLPDGVPQPARRALASIGITRVAQLEERTEAEVRTLHGMGPYALRLLYAALEAEGRWFAPDKPDGESDR